MASVAIAKQCRVYTENGSGALEAGGWTDYVSFAGAEAHTYTVDQTKFPSGCFIFFAVKGASNYYVDDKGGTAAPPGASVTDGTGPMLNPTVRFFPKDIASISIYADGAGLVQLDVRQP